MTTIRLLGVEDEEQPKKHQKRKSNGLTKALRAAMSDGKWHSLRQITSTVTFYIQPDYALRIYDMQKGRSAGRRISEAHKVELGRRHLVEIEIHKAISHEVHHEDGLTFYRMILSRAVCQDCHQTFDHTKKTPPSRCESCMREMRAGYLAQGRKKLGIG